ncbi:MAG: class I SAM-dependent methyltransferase, partial [Myxococcota bacterium]
DGSYEPTAAVLEPAAAALVERAAPAPGEAALDLGCGTGTASARLAAAGASVVGVDPAARLLEVARAAVPAATFRRGTAEAIPADDRSFELAVSSFALIFCPEPQRAAAELARVIRPGGRFLMSAWLPEGGISAASIAMFTIAARHLPPMPPRPAWGDPAFVQGLFEQVGATVTIARETLRFSAPSAAAWFADQESNHPGWRAVRRALADAPGAWDEVRAASVAALEAASARGPTMEVDSPYFVVEARFG